MNLSRAHVINHRPVDFAEMLTRTAFPVRPTDPYRPELPICAARGRSGSQRMAAMIHSQRNLVMVNNTDGVPR
jgi:hypothetical protein